MKVEVIYQLPMDNLTPEFLACAEMWADTYREYSAGADHEVVICCSNGVATERERSLFRGIKCRFEEIASNGWDIGAFQTMAERLTSDFAVFMNSRTYFWKPGWLARLVATRLEVGEGLFGASASYEYCPLGSNTGPNPHIRTSCFACSPAVLSEYPYRVDSRDDGFRFESGCWNFSTWFEDCGYPVRLVTWDGAYRKDQWRTPPNIFRRGDQSNCLVQDRHTTMWRNASDELKRVFSASADSG